MTLCGSGSWCGCWSCAAAGAGPFCAPSPLTAADWEEAVEEEEEESAAAKAIAAAAKEVAKAIAAAATAAAMAAATVKAAAAASAEAGGPVNAGWWLRVIPAHMQALTPPSPF